MSWLTQRGDNSRRSYNPSGSSAIGTLLWTYTLTAGFYFVGGSPVIASDGTIYITETDYAGDNDYLTSLASDGTLNWRTNITHGTPPGPRSDIGYVGVDPTDRPYVMTDRNSLAVYNTDGTLVWEYYTDSSVEDYIFPGSPVCDADGTFYCFGQILISTNLCLFHIDTDGTLLSKTDLGLSGAGFYYQYQFDDAISINGSNLFFASDSQGGGGPQSGVAKVTTGAAVTWSSLLTYAFRGTAVVNPVTGDVYCAHDELGGGVNGDLVCLKSSDGSVVWTVSGIVEYDSGTNGNNLQPAIDGNGDIYIQKSYDGITHNAHLIKLSGVDGSLIWDILYHSASKPGLGQADVSIGSDGLIWCAGDVLRIDPSDGSILETYVVTPGPGYNGFYQTAIADDMVLVPYDDTSTLYALGPGGPPPPPPDPYILPGKCADSPTTDAENLSIRCHREAIEQELCYNLYYFRI